MNILIRPFVAAMFALAAGIAYAADANLIAFVGQKIKVQQFTLPECNDCVVMDSAFHAEYRVLKRVYGQYDGDLIRFDAFDHYGWPRFSNYKHVLLFVSKAKDGSLYHQKYQYFPVYETLDGDWAACGSADQFEHPTYQGPSTARPIAFKQPVVESLRGMPPDEIAHWFYATDWHITKDRAICLRGTPLAELFEAKKRGVLKARGVFE